MTDVFDPAKRSEVMSRIRGSGTKPEGRLFEIVRAVVRDELGPRRRVMRNAAHLIGTPDVWVPSVRLALFADGCFFHGCPRHLKWPRNNAAFWRQKIEGNRRRDRRQTRELRSAGVSVWRVWEHDLKLSALPAAERRVRRAVRHAAKRAADR